MIQLTDEQKKAFAEKCSVECDEVKSDKPQDIFESTIDEYVQTMQAQIAYLTDAVNLHKRMANMLSYDLNRTDVELTENTRKVYTEELKVREDLISKCISAIAVMHERLTIAEATKKWMLENFEQLQNVDFFLNNRLDLPGTKERVQEIVDKLSK